MRRVMSLLPVLVRREIRTKYRTSVLDMAWALITPIAVLAVYGIVLTRSFSVTASCAPYLTSAWTGLVIWTVFATAVGGGVTSLVASSELITKVYFPLEAMPLSHVGLSLVDLVVGGATLIPLALVQGVRFTPTALWVVLPVAVLVVWSSVFAVLAAVIAVFVRDAVHLVMLLLRVGFFATPVMYESSFLPPALAWTADVNPVAASIDGVRAALLCGEVPAIGVLGVQLALGLLAFGAVVLYVRSVESRVVDVV
jgi:ABC-type polysaccharide/polyol phosphate export permease